jgi:hypothetical protein
MTTDNKNPLRGYAIRAFQAVATVAGLTPLVMMAAPEGLYSQRMENYMRAENFPEKAITLTEPGDGRVYNRDSYMAAVHAGIMAGSAAMTRQHIRGAGLAQGFSSAASVAADVMKHRLPARLNAAPLYSQVIQRPAGTPGPCHMLPAGKFSAADFVALATGLSAQDVKMPDAGKIGMYLRRITFYHEAQHCTQAGAETDIDLLRFETKADLKAFATADAGEAHTPALQKAKHIFAASRLLKGLMLKRNENGDISAHDGSHYSWPALKRGGTNDAQLQRDSNANGTLSMLIGAVIDRNPGFNVRSAGVSSRAAFMSAGYHTAKALLDDGVLARDESTRDLKTLARDFVETVDYIDTMTAGAIRYAVTPPSRIDTGIADVLANGVRFPAAQKPAKPVF